jgi:hypothetical protein
MVADKLRTQTRGHWIEKLTAAGVPCGSVRNLQEVFDDPQLAARAMIAEIERTTIGPLRTSRTGQTLRHTRRGAHATSDAGATHRRRAAAGPRNRTGDHIAAADSARDLKLMEIADVRNRLTQTIERSRRGAAARRTRNDQAAKAFETFLDRSAVPLFKQIGNVLKIENYPFTVFTPSGSVRLMSDRSADDYIELSLDTSGTEPRVMGTSGTAAAARRRCRTRD